jgi:hypothetical protein
VSLLQGEGLPSGLAVWDAEGRHRVVLGHGPEPERDASLELWDPAGAYRVGLGTWPDGSTGLELLDDRAEVRGRVGERPDRSFSVDFWDRDGTYRHGLGSPPS